MRKLFIFTLLFIIIQIGIGQSKTFTFPFQTGDIWQYYVNVMGNPDFSHYTLVHIDHDTLMPNNKVYKVFSSGLTPFFYFRQDSARIFQYAVQDSTEFPRYDFSRNVGDTISIVYSDGLGYPIILWADRNELVFGQTRRTVTFFSPTNHLISDEVVDSIGILHFIRNVEFDYRLTAAIIGGRSYGTIVDVSKSVTSVPKYFSLYQNYPNPFNPSTSIEFDLSNKVFVSLKILNVLGQTMMTLVEEKKESGHYKVEWIAAKYPSGIYICVLKIGNDIQTKKMILLK
jgi:hypothetical protein